MRKVEFKVCRKCNKMYRWESGGIVMTPRDHMDMGLCERCRAKMVFNTIGDLFKRKK